MNNGSTNPWPWDTFPVRWDGNYDASWEVFGTRIEDSVIVDVTVGILTSNGSAMVVVDVCDDMPIALTPDDVRRLYEALQEALEKYEDIEQRREQQRLEAAHQMLGRAVLSREQWEAIVGALSESNTSTRESALTALKASAPQTWIDQAQREDDQ